MVSRLQPATAVPTLHATVFTAFRQFIDRIPPVSLPCHYRVITVSLPAKWVVRRAVQAGPLHVLKNDTFTQSLFVVIMMVDFSSQGPREKNGYGYNSFTIHLVVLRHAGRLELIDWIEPGKFAR